MTATAMTRITSWYSGVILFFLATGVVIPWYIVIYYHYVLCSIAKMTAQMRNAPHIWVPWKFSAILTTSTAIFPFERALVRSYRPSIVTFHLSLRVSEILPLLFSRTPFFPYPTSSLPKISACSPDCPENIRGSPFGYEEQRCWANSLCN